MVMNSIRFRADSILLCWECCIVHQALRQDNYAVGTSVFLSALVSAPVHFTLETWNTDWRLPPVAAAAVLLNVLGCRLTY